ncbi:hypothetical protein K2173_024136 [Erythroxylum novogranatense]|uniref:Uncharacterized protein n=1 Tax=Erythroxylum novogranatense TaxID=1862640 RepID=A0AAV8UFL0_9ROSI|nr:hypothetical protein K2173_024136 [Erythroxylum novogranatense]
MIRSLTHAAGWTRDDDKAFECALVMYPENSADRWHLIARQVGRSVGEVVEHYNLLVHDVNEIDSGRVQLPDYADDLSSDSDLDSGSNHVSSGGKTRDIERKKGTAWTEEEHKLFLIGLQKFGKGDWRSISRNVVMTRTPTQVASHAQKYFLRQSAVKKERKRSSIHDITSVDATQPVEDNWAPPPTVPVHQHLIFQPMNPGNHMPLPSHMPNQGPPLAYQTSPYPF